MKRTMITIIEDVVNCILPDICLNCNLNYVNLSQIICDSCERKLKRMSHGPVITFQAKQLHNNLAISARYFYFSRLIYCLLYDEVLRTIYQNAKFNERRFAKKFLTEVLSKKISQVVTSNDYLIPVPSSSRLVTEITKLIAKEKGATYLNIFEKKKLMSVKKSKKIIRYEKIRESLIVKKRLTKKILKRTTIAYQINEIEVNIKTKQSRVIVVDDVWSTGSTMNEVCYRLTSLGISRDSIISTVFFYNSDNTDNPNNKDNTKE